jgi:SAM-dependent methyltransferase
MRPGRIDSWLRFGNRWVPGAFRPIAVRWFDRITDAMERQSGGDRSLLPPLRLRLHVGPFHDPTIYRASAERNLLALCELGALRPDATVLDLGCGSGRIAAALSGYLSAEGRYEGLDVAAEPVAWCARTITPKFPKFRFLAWDVASPRYNPEGRVQPAEAVLPYPTGTFDLAFAGSVYTHLDLAGIARSLVEVARVLRPGGRLVATFCLLNERSLPVVRAGASEPRLGWTDGTIWTRRPHDPIDFVAIPEARARALLAEAGLPLVEVHYGPWARAIGDRSEMAQRYGFNQDIVVARKPSTCPSG